MIDAIEVRQCIGMMGFASVETLVIER